MATETLESLTTLNTLTDKLIDMSEVIGIVRLSRTQLYDLIKANQFPDSVSILNGQAKRIRCAYWRMSDVQNWISNLSNAPRSAEI
jgi:predicted DNA-binding transcriptional regulator AlpA